METSKYYTPEFHEFHEGFEYFDSLFHGPHFVQKTFTTNDVDGWRRGFFIKGIDNGQIKVKHLDREDIESLGWNKKTFHNKQYFLMDFYLEDLNDNHYAIFSGHQEDITFLRLFTGEIKNKSELKKIMQQICIKTN